MLPFRPPRLPRSSMLVAASLAAGLALGTAAWLTLGADSFAQDRTAKEEEADRPAKPRKRPAKPVEKQEESAAAPAPHPAAPAQTPTPAVSAPPPDAVAPAVPDLAGQLRQAGAGTCAPQVDALAAGSMAGVAQFNTLSNWSTTGGDRRVVSLSIGQKYPAGNAVPYGATTVIAAPNPQGSCDAVAVQVVPSPLPCDKLRETIATRGRAVGDLAGVAAMADNGGQTLLVPTAAGTCVLVGLRSAYAK